MLLMPRHGRDPLPPPGRDGVPPRYEREMPPAGAYGRDAPPPRTGRDMAWYEQDARLQAPYDRGMLPPGREGPPGSGRNGAPPVAAYGRDGPPGYGRDALPPPMRNGPARYERDGMPDYGRDVLPARDAPPPYGRDPPLPFGRDAPAGYGRDVLPPPGRYDRGGRPVDRYDHAGPPPDRYDRGAGPVPGRADRGSLPHAPPYRGPDPRGAPGPVYAEARYEVGGALPLPPPPSRLGYSDGPPRPPPAGAAPYGRAGASSPPPLKRRRSLSPPVRGALPRGAIDDRRGVRGVRDAGSRDVPLGGAFRDAGGAAARGASPPRRSGGVDARVRAVSRERGGAHAVGGGAGGPVASSRVVGGGPLPAHVAAAAVDCHESDAVWMYTDPAGLVRGPHTISEFVNWTLTLLGPEFVDDRRSFLASEVRAWWRGEQRLPGTCAFLWSQGWLEGVREVAAACSSSCRCTRPLLECVHGFVRQSMPCMECIFGPFG